MKIITLPPEDWPKYRAVRLEALQNDPQAFGATYKDDSAKSESEWKSRLENPNNIYVFAQDQDNDTLVGMMGAFKKEGDVWYVVGVYVNSQFRGKGISTQLIEHLLEKFKQKNGKNIELMVNINQASAIALYKKFGFEIIETLKDQKMGDGSIVDEYLMRK